MLISLKGGLLLLLSLIKEEFMGTIFFMVLLVAAVIVLGAVSRRIQRGEQRVRGEYREGAIAGSKMGSLAAGILLVLVLLISSFYTIDEGEGCVLTQFGRVYDMVSRPGLHFKRPWADVVKWRTRLKAIHQKMDARTADDMRVDMDLTFWWATMPDKLNRLYSSVAKDYETLEEGFVIPGIRSAIRDQVAKLDYRELNTNRDKYAEIITIYVAVQLAKKFVLVDRINIRNIIPPAGVDKAIELKLEAKQDAERAEHRLMLAKKDAEIRIAEAKGIAKAQRIIREQLTPIYVQYESIQVMKKLSDSKNSTFIFIPTSKSGAGVPMVWNAPIK
jgi:prohibitin 1